MKKTIILLLFTILFASSAFCQLTYLDTLGVKITKYDDAILEGATLTYKTKQYHLLSSGIWFRVCFTDTNTFRVFSHGLCCEELLSNGMRITFESRLFTYRNDSLILSSTDRIKYYQTMVTSRKKVEVKDCLLTVTTKKNTYEQSEESIPQLVFSERVVNVDYTKLSAILNDAPQKTIPSIFNKDTGHQKE